MLDTITSTKNPLVARFKSLRTKRGREEAGVFLVEGEKMIKEALEAGLLPREALIEKPLAPEIIKELEKMGAKIYPVQRHVLEACCDTMTPSGACCSFSPPKPLDQGNPPKFLIALDGLQDPGNAGTIWRTADAAGFEGMIFGEGCADALAPKVVRGTMGSAFRIPVAQVECLADALHAFRESGYEIVVTSLLGEDIYRRGPLGGKFVLVIGSEAHGVSEAVNALATVRLKLPMRGGAESLNAAVAAGIIMYELTREMA